MAFEFAPLDWLFLAVLFAKLIDMQIQSVNPPLRKGPVGVTHTKQLLAKPIVHFQVRIPKTTLHIDLAGSTEVEKDCILRRDSKSKKMSALERRARGARH
jgi:hypothetical protein